MKFIHFVAVHAGSDPVYVELGKTGYWWVMGSAVKEDGGKDIILVSDLGNKEDSEERARSLAETLNNSLSDECKFLHRLGRIRVGIRRIPLSEEDLAQVLREVALSETVS